MSSALRLLAQEVAACERCSRLRKYCREVAKTKRRAYLDWEYWGKPVPAFGDYDAQVLVIGLAPGAHGANRTGRMFTGDRSGEFLYRALYETGFASQAQSESVQDGLTLRNIYITASVHCAPPDNKPTPQEFHRCRPFLERELDLLPRVRVVVALGRLAFDTYLSILKARGVIARRADYVFAHNRRFETGPGAPILISCYHPSQQNTSTGKLTREMLRDVFDRVREELGKE